MSGETLALQGVVREGHRGGVFVVDCRLGSLRREVLAKVCGRLVTRHIRVLPGDAVLVEVSAYDTKRGRIVQRMDRTTT